MSLDTLFRQIIITEQHVSNNCRQLQEAKSAIATYFEQVKKHREQLKCLEDELHQEGHFLSEMILQCDLLKKKQEHLEHRNDELQQQQQRLRNDQETQKNWDMEQQKIFIAETKAFNCEYCLLRHRHTIVYRQACAEMLRLMQEAGILRKEMQYMTQTNAHMTLKQEKKTVLQSNLTQLEIQHRGVDIVKEGQGRVTTGQRATFFNMLPKIQTTPQQWWWWRQRLTLELETEVEEAASLTSSLKVEKTAVTKKPVLDKLCLRLKDEVGMHKEGNLELKHQMLSAKIQLLQKKLRQKI
ncbi:uncharacterized protein LOC121685498 isoform X1 [Alosa sapidissima]|uniref:uncharacterized protein LOC121685498 isoform X1 n=1 Tax=Alosa sapidissima TaxID=34773 RepID=UPI001C0881C3|nr:uncharacterized protein LOC121685498 isoform X1 [Alosa sapidissima]